MRFKQLITKLFINKLLIVNSRHLCLATIFIAAFTGAN